MMRRLMFYLVSSAAVVMLSTSAANAQPRHAKIADAKIAHARTAHIETVAHHRYRYGTATALDIPYREQRPSFGNPYPLRPQYGYEEAPYDPYYQGPGAEVFRRTIQSAHEPGVTLQIEPEAKETATGGPAGGLPSQSGGGR